MEGIAAERDKLEKLVADLEAWLKDSKSRLGDSELRVTKEREANKELKEEPLIYKKKVVEQHEKGFQKVVRQAEFFTKDLDLSLFDPFKDAKGGVLLDEEENSTEDEAINEEQSDDAAI